MMKPPEEKIKGQAQNGRKETPHRDESRSVKKISDRTKNEIRDSKNKNGPVARNKIRKNGHKNVDGREQAGAGHKSVIMNTAVQDCGMRRIDDNKKKKVSACRHA